MSMGERIDCILGFRRAKVIRVIDLDNGECVIVHYELGKELRRWRVGMDEAPRRVQGCMAYQMRCTYRSIASSDED